MFTTRVTDVFSLPKLVALWGLLTVVSMLIVARIVVDEAPPRLRLVGVVDAPVALFVALFILALAVSTDRRQSLFGERLQHQGVLTMLLYVGFFYVARSLVRDVIRLGLLQVAVMIGAVFVSGYAIVQKLKLDPIWHGQLPSGRVFSTIGQPNALAAYLVVAIPITAALALTSRRALRLVALAAVAVMIGALIFTSSRGGYLGVALAAAVFAYGVRDRNKVRLTAGEVYAGAAIIAIMLVLVIVAPVRSTVAGLWHSNSGVGALNGDESVDEHLDLWRVALEIVERHPILGTGPETFPDQFPRYAPAVLPAATVDYLKQFRVESPHNQPLAIATGAGIPAALAYLAVLVGLARTLWRRASRSTDPAERAAIIAVVAAGAGHLVTDSFMTADITASWLFWTLAGASVGLATIRTAAASAGTTRPFDPGHARTTD